METKGGHKILDVVKIKLGFDNLFMIHPVGRKGGMAMLWKSDFGI